MTNRTMWVVAGALCRSDGKILMHKRPAGKHHAGLWEFPGGKVEESEVPENALIRELKEELGVSITAGECDPVAFAEDSGRGTERPIVILLYRIDRWSGKPTALEGGELDWFEPNQIGSLEKPPLDVVLAERFMKAM